KAVACKMGTAEPLADGHEWMLLNREIRAYGDVLVGGRGKLTGKIFRLGLFGSVTVGEILGAIAVLERVSLEQGRPIEPGRAVAAAQAAALAVQSGAAGDSGPGGSRAAGEPEATRRSAEPATVPA